MSRAIFRGPKKSYTFTDNDVEWLARSMWGESSSTEGRIAVAWTHINRFLLFNYKWLQEGWTFVEYVQGHSQPINPIWRRDGWKCVVGGPYHGKPDCSEDRLAKRDMYQKSAVPSAIRTLAEDFAAGKHKNPFSEPTYDFAATNVVEHQGRPCIGIVVAGNAHLTYGCLKESEQKSVVPGEVSITGVTGEVLVKGFMMLVIFATGYGLWRLVRG